jgi:phage tail-like protein
MASVLRVDPVGIHNFYLTLIDTSDVVGTVISAVVSYKMAGFSECSGLESTVEVMEYREGGVNNYVHKFPTRTLHANLVLKQGVIYLADPLWEWHDAFVRGEPQRKDGVIALLDEARQPAKVWKFRRGIPTKWVGPSLNAQQSQVAIESIEIAHEGLVLEVGV